MKVRIRIPEIKVKIPSATEFILALFCMGLLIAVIAISFPSLFSEQIPADFQQHELDIPTFLNGTPLPDSLIHYGKVECSLGTDFRPDISSFNYTKVAWTEIPQKLITDDMEIFTKLKVGQQISCGRIGKDWDAEWCNGDFQIGEICIADHFPPAAGPYGTGNWCNHNVIYCCGGDYCLKVSVSNDLDCICKENQLKSEVS